MDMDAFGRVPDNCPDRHHRVRLGFYQRTRDYERTVLAVVIPGRQGQILPETEGKVRDHVR